MQSSHKRHSWYIVAPNDIEYQKKKFYIFRIGYIKRHNRGLEWTDCSCWFLKTPQAGRFYYCSTIWVVRQSRRFLCLFWRETRQRIFGPEISAYPEVVRGRERELAGKKSWQAVGDWTANRVGVEPRTGAVNTGLRRQ